MNGFILFGRIRCDIKIDLFFIFAGIIMKSYYPHSSNQKMFRDKCRGSLPTLPKFLGFRPDKNLVNVRKPNNAKMEVTNREIEEYINRFNRKSIVTQASAERRGMNGFLFTSRNRTKRLLYKTPSSKCVYIKPLEVNKF